MISIIVAMDKNRGIGFHGKLLTHIPDDLKHFKKLTDGHTVIMGRKTFDSLPNGPLQNRRNIVISRKTKSIDGCEVYDNIDEALASISSDELGFVIGGQEIYEQCIYRCDSLIITHIDKVYHSDTKFPEIPDQYIKSSEEEYEHNGTKFCIATYDNYFS